MIHSTKDLLDLKNYEKHEKIFYNRKTKYYEIINSVTGEKNIAKFFTKTIDDCSRSQVLDLNREVYINSKLKHPSFLQFIGFSSIDFKSRPRPVIVFEHISTLPLNLQIKSPLNSSDYHRSKDLKYQMEIPSNSGNIKSIYQQNAIQLNATKN